MRSFARLLWDISLTVGSTEKNKMHEGTRSIFYICNDRINGVKSSRNARSISTTGVCWNKYFRQILFDGLARIASEIRRDDGREKLFCL